LGKKNVVCGSVTKVFSRRERRANGESKKFVGNKRSGPLERKLVAGVGRVINTTSCTWGKKITTALTKVLDRTEKVQNLLLFIGGLWGTPTRGPVW